MDRPNHAAHVTLVHMEATKESARRVQLDTFKTSKERRHAKNVQSTRIFPKKASRQKQIVNSAAFSMLLTQIPTINWA